MFENMCKLQRQSGAYKWSSSFTRDVCSILSVCCLSRMKAIISTLMVSESYKFFSLFFIFDLNGL